MQIRLPQIILAALIVVAAISVVIVYFGGSDDSAPQVAVNTTASGQVADCIGEDGKLLPADDCAEKLPMTDEANTNKVASLGDETADSKVKDPSPAPSANAEEMVAAAEKKVAEAKAAEAKMAAEAEAAAEAEEIAAKKRRKAAEKKAAAKKKAAEKKAAEREAADANKAAEAKKAAVAAKAAKAKLAAEKKAVEKKAAEKKTTEKKTAQKTTADKANVPAAAREAGEVYVAKRSDRDVSGAGETKPFNALIPGRYVVIGSFDSVANAQILQERYRNWGAILVPIRINGEPRQRVVIGPFSRTQLKGELARVAETGVNGAWTMSVRLADVARKQ